MIVLQTDHFSLFSQGLQGVLRALYLYKDLQKALQERMKDYFLQVNLYVVSSKLLLYIA